MFLSEFAPEYERTIDAKTAKMAPMPGRPPKKLAKYPNRIREVRDARGLTIDGLARAVRISRANLQRYEVGDRELKVRDLEIIARGLNVQPQVLLNSYRAVEDAQEIEMLEIMRRISPADRDRLVRMARGLLSEPPRSVA